MSSEAVPPWDSAPVDAHLRDSRFAGRVTHLVNVGSTSTVALQAAQSGSPPEDHVWVADEQTAGRGRGGHQWHSEPRSGLYFSVLVWPTLPRDRSLWLSLATGLAVQAAVLAVTGLSPDLRWPNDLMAGEKKFGGILVETSTPAAGDAGGALRYAVIGIGINVAHTMFPAGLDSTATSLRLATGRLWPRETLFAAILQGLEREIEGLELSGSTLLERFAEASSWVRGKPVIVGEAPNYTGITAGIDERGFLRVLADDGTLRTVLSGGVRPR